jgi:hypothetical protein
MACSGATAGCSESAVADSPSSALSGQHLAAKTTPQFSKSVVGPKPPAAFERQVLYTIRMNTSYSTEPCPFTFPSPAERARAAHVAAGVSRGMPWPDHKAATLVAALYTQRPAKTPVSNATWELRCARIAKKCLTSPLPPRKIAAAAVSPLKN